MSPTLKVGIALALVEPAAAGVDSELQVAIRNRRMSAKVVRTPFVK
jgi:aminomethyltransferase